MQFIKVSLIKLIPEFIVVFRWRYSVYTLESFLNNLLFSVLHYDLEQTTKVTVVEWHSNWTCKSSSTLTHSNIFKNLVSSSKTKWKYNTQLSNSLNWKPAGAIDSFKFLKVLIISRSWIIDVLKCSLLCW